MPSKIRFPGDYPVLVDETGADALEVRSDTVVSYRDFTAPNIPTDEDMAGKADSASTLAGYGITPMLDMVEAEISDSAAVRALMASLRRAGLMRISPYTAYDSFARPASPSSLGTAETDEAWEVLNGTFGIAEGGFAYMTAGANPAAVIDCGSPNGVVSLVLQVIEPRPRLILRATNASNFVMVQAHETAGVQLWTCIAGVFAQVGASVAHTWASGDKITATLAGDLISVAVNDVEMISDATVTHNSAATKHGIGGNSGSYPETRFGAFSYRPPIGGELDLFVVAGQSNAMGAGSSAQSPAVAVGTAYEWNGALVHLQDPVANANTGSAWPAFANAYYGSTGRIPVIVGTAVSGSAQHPDASLAEGHDWSATGDHYAACVSAVQAAVAGLEALGYTVNFRGVLWHQGERDSQAIEAGSIVIADYQTEFEAMIARFRTEFGATMPFFIFRVGRRESADTAGFIAVRGAQDAVAAAQADTHMVYTDCVNFPANGWMADSVHYTQDGYNDMGSVGGANVAAILP